MRRQDELLALYPGSDSLTRKFIISQAEALSLAFDSDELLEFLQGELADPEPVVRHQALYTLSRFLPGFIKKRYSLSEHAVGVWSSYGQEKQALKLPAPTQDIESKKESRRIACLYSARAVADALVPLADSASSRVKKAARLALSQFPLQSIRDRFHQSAKSAPDFQGFLTCAALSGGPADDEFVMKAIREHGPRSPDLLLLLAECSREPEIDLVMDLIARCDRVGRMNIGSALGKLSNIDHGEAAKRLAATKEGWVIVYALRALEATGKAPYLKLIASFYDKSNHDFVKAQAVRAAGGLSGQDAIEFCLRAVESKSDRLQAQALESLVRLRCPAEVLRKAAGPLIESKSLRARVNAILATAQPEDEEPPGGLMDLLMSNDPVERLEAAYVLGYLQNPRSLAYLNTLVGLDPNLNVKLQATKSLSKYRSKDSLPYLLPLLGNTEARLALTAARVLARYEGEEAANVCEAIDAALGKATQKFERALLYRALGTVAGKSAYPHAEVPLRRGLDEKDAKVLAGVVEGWNLFWCKRSDDVNERLRKIVTQGDARSRPRALMALYMGGDLEAIGQLGALLGGKDEKQLGPAIETALEVGLLVPEFVHDDKFPALTTRLDEISATPDVRRFANECDSAVLQSLGRRGLVLSAPPASAQQEGEFDVKRAPRLKRPKPSSPAIPAVPAPVSASKALAVPAPVSDAGAKPLPVRVSSKAIQAPAAAAPGVEALEKHLQKEKEKPADKGPAFHQRLAQMTYLVGERLAEPAFWEKVAAYKYVWLPAVLMLGVFAFVVSTWFGRMDEKPRPKHPLSVSTLFGDVVMTPPGTRAEVDQDVPAKAKIKLGPASRVQLNTMAGSYARFEAPMEIQVEKIHDSNRSLELAISQPGYCYFAFRKTGEIQVTLGKHVMKGREVAFSVEVDEGKVEALVHSGRLTVGLDTGPVEIGEGDAVPLTQTR
jgi:HEAT repeat protein